MNNSKLLIKEHLYYYVIILHLNIESSNTYSKIVIFLRPFFSYEEANSFEIFIIIKNKIIKKVQNHNVMLN